MITIYLLLGLTIIIWIALSIIVRRTGPEKLVIVGKEFSDNQKALIVYNPDPIYNLDEKICRSFAEGLSSKGWLSKIATVAAVKNVKEEQFDLYVFCANTYNWVPDKAIRNHIKNNTNLKGKNTVAITLGSGSTKMSQHVLEDLIKQKQSVLIDSRAFWLMKPNDETKKKRSNIKIAIEMANTFGEEIGESITN